MNKNELSLYLVTDRYDYDLPKFLKIVETACQNGVTMVQLREKKVTTREYYELALAVKEVTRRYHVPLIIDDRLDVCLAVDAEGLHIGDDELPVSIVRRLLGPDKILGVSAKTVERALEAEAEGADYLGTGAMYPTQTKVITQPTSFATLAEIVTTVKIPVVAIGGINEERVKNFQGIGIVGICMVSELMKAADVAAKTKAVRQAVDEVLKGGVV